MLEMTPGLVACFKSLYYNRILEFAFHFFPFLL
jgi:hypothetical protein